MEGLSLNGELIHVFRERVNERDFVNHVYQNKSGKNYWSIICSAMDWIETVINRIDIKQLSRKNDNEASLKVMIFIMCIDILWEAIQQLSRIFVDQKTLPFDQKESIFQNKMISSTDNEYFKTIRACFAAHPVNLRDDFSGNGINEKRYASWSGGGVGKEDFAVILYSNIPGREDKFFNISFEELYNFANERYQYLNVIIDRIDEEEKNYNGYWKKQTIKEEQEPLAQIYVLEEEQKKRFGNSCYTYELETLKMLFGISVADINNRYIVGLYKKTMLLRIEEIKNALQQMQNVELKEVKDAIPYDCQYDFSKLSDAVFGSTYVKLYSTVHFKAHLEGIVDLEKCASEQELYITIKAAFHYKHLKCEH